MKKNNIGKRPICSQSLFRLNAIILFSFVVLSISAQITVNVQNQSIRQILKTIEKQSDYSFFYNEGLPDLEKITSLNVANKDVKTTLNILLAGTNISFGVEDNTVVLTAKQKLKTTITGIVIDKDGEPIIGATVTVKGGTTGTMTDVDGRFSFSLNIQSETRLKISYMGYEVQEIKVDGRTNFRITLKEDEKLLDEVVVIGYGTQRKKDLTGSISAVQGQLIEERKTAQLSTALQGSMSGVMVERTNGSPGATGSIKIRGITTIGDSNPLIIVDGMPVSNINDVNANDVENISVLKDAASAAIYGARAASGVILITTKRGESDKIALDYTYEYGIERPTVNPKYVDIVRFMQMTNELRWNDAGNGSDDYPEYSKNTIENYYTLNAADPNTYPNTNWQDLILQGSAPRQSHLLGISGGTKSVKTKASLIYDQVDGLYVNRSFDRFTTRVNNDFSISKIIAASLDINFKRSSYIEPVSIPNTGMRMTPALYPAIWQNGSIASGKSGNNPYAALTEGGTTNTWYTQMGGKATIDIIPLKDLKISASVSPTYNFDKIKKFTKEVSYYSQNDPNEKMGKVEGHNATKLQENRNDYYNITTLIVANYMKQITNHDFNIMGGYETFYSYSESLFASRGEYELNNFPYLDVGPETLRDNGGNAYETAYRSYFGRIMYGFKSKYLLQANVRYDGSSRFASDCRWGTFPSFSGGWVISEESFMKDIPALSFLKFRASWGTLGNERIGNYPYQSTIVYNNGLFYQGDAIVSQITAAQQQYAIRDITWETTSSFNFGVDLALFNNKLRITSDYYDKQTKDMLLELEIPDYVGYDNPNQNTGKMYTQGWDVEIAWRDKIGDFTYGISANLSDFKSKIGDLGGTEFLGDQIKKEGSEFNEWYGYVSDGFYQSAEDIANLPKLNDNVKPGDIKYKDISGPDGEPDGIISPEYDRVLLGGSLPRYLFGGNFYVGYKGIDLSVSFQGIGKQLVRKDNISKPLGEDWQNIPNFIDEKYWSNYKTADENANASYPRLTRTGVNNNYILSDFWLFNGGYSRLKNITLGYTIPQSIAEKVSMKNIKIYASVNDLLCFNQYPEGWDPELSGVGSYPITSSFLFGISVKF